LVAFALLAFPLSGMAQKQKKVKVTYQSIASKCDSAALPLDQRIRLAVSRFNVTARNTPADLGDNMGTILENALAGMNCFRVLESKSNLDDMVQEMDGVDDGLMDGGSTARAGKMLGAQLVVTGEITEYNEGTSSVGVAVVKAGSSTVHMGFVLKVLDPQTRDILWSKSVDVDGKKGGDFAVGVGLPFKEMGRVDLFSSMRDNPALANAMEKAVVESCALLVDNWQKIPLPESADPDVRWTVFTVTNVDYGAASSFESIVKGQGNVKGTERTFSNGTAKVTVRHKGSSQDLLDGIYGHLQDGYTVVDAREGAITLSRK
jgi:curli biogenesis system outer membrane secretion channel CsgG